VSDRAPALALVGNASKGHLAKWASHFASIGWRVYVASFEPAEIAGVDVIQLRKSAPSHARYFFAASQLRRILKRIKPSIVHAHYASGYGLLGALSATATYIISVWGSDVYEFPRRSPIHAQLLRFTLNTADYVCSTSWAMARESRRYTRQPITVTPFGIDCAEYDPGLGSNGGAGLVVGTVKTLDAMYGIAYLLRAFALVVHRAPRLEVRLVIAGGGPQRYELEQLARELGIAQHTRFLGPLPQPCVPSTLRGFSVYAALSERESFGVAVLEASACGIPVLATDVDGLPEVVENGITGLLVPPRDVVSAANAMERLLRDRRLRARLGAAGRKFVLERYQWADTAKIMERLYDAALNEAPPPGPLYG